MYVQFHIWVQDVHLKGEILNQQCWYTCHNITIPCSGIHLNFWGPPPNEPGGDIPGRQGRNND